MKVMLFILWVSFASCPFIKDSQPGETPAAAIVIPADKDTIPGKLLPPSPGKSLPVPAPGYINTGSATPTEVLAFAKTLQGIPYKYASTDPAVGFDCSGFITYVFNHFNIAVPRSSVDFTNVNQEVPLSEAKPGDLILFTGTDSTIRIVGHMGILVSAANGDYEFIHSTSGKSYGVTITPLSNYYSGRFVKVVRIFPQNNMPA
jgi:cell wall-associated NlpC family hydrolase